MIKILNRFLTILLIILICLLVLNKYYIIEFSESLKNVFMFLTLVIILLTSVKEITIGKSGLSKFLSVIILLCTTIGGIFAVISHQLNAFIYICLLFSVLQCLIELVGSKA